MKRQKTKLDDNAEGKKQRRSETGLAFVDFDSCANMVITADDVVGKSFSDCGQTKQYAIKNEINNEVHKLFQKFNVDSNAAISECLKFIAKNHQQAITARTTKNSDDVITRVLSGLSLADRNQLIRLLTHSSNHLNAEVLEIYPSLRARSETLLAAGRRKERCDKVDLQFISDFMHDYCRYDPMFV